FSENERDNEWMKYSWILSTINLVMFYLPGVQEAVNILIAFNRFFALCFPFAYNKVFTSTNTHIMICASLIYSIVFVFPVIGAFGNSFKVESNWTEPIYVISVTQT
ncbi:hypothetical protein PMAYCL1PPCAC_25274, partial [Pristionchus mayeri]